MKSAETSLVKERSLKAKKVVDRHRMHAALTTIFICVCSLASSKILSLNAGIIQTQTQRLAPINHDHSSQDAERHMIRPSDRSP